MDSTVTDFWRMIWEQQSKVIIMLTDLVENGVEKCTEYIPPSEITDCRRLYGDFQVTLKKRETKEKYAISTLHLNVSDMGKSTMENFSNVCKNYSIIIIILCYVWGKSTYTSRCRIIYDKNIYDRQFYPIIKLVSI